ncbi:DNA ligase [Providencia phage PSTCR5]|uniref:DNA ligase n=1 Tax=Providencia phage PSTCR5 TaxID=2783547 RepID=A0A873WS11_9CAUD|nr:NAD-dependent DNA ligase [Providencia phage PSTCR5]QPB12108.1 DNA ligase [Providencia phage PSTCR5]
MKIQIPTHCPICGSVLERVNSQLFCRNKDNCSAQSSKSLESFCKKMKLKGFGEKTLEKLELTSVPELFYIDSSFLEEILGEKIGNKLSAELDRMRTSVEMSTLLASLSIPLVGTVAAEKAVAGATSLADTKLSGKAGESLEVWKHSDLGKEIMALPWNFTKVTQVVNETESLGIAVCVTGSVEGHTRTSITKHLESLGFTVKKSVTKDVKYLICEDESKRSSSSYLKALENGVEIGSLTKLILKYKRNK